MHSQQYTKIEVIMRRIGIWMIALVLLASGCAANRNRNKDDIAPSQLASQLYKDNGGWSVPPGKTGLDREALLDSDGKSQNDYRESEQEAMDYSNSGDLNDYPREVARDSSHETDYSNAINNRNMKSREKFTESSSRQTVRKKRAKPLVPAFPLRMRRKKVNCGSKSTFNLTRLLKKKLNGITNE